MTTNTGGFVDLRVHRATESSHSDDSIWPSFTDIMMVVVMVFLMAAVVFMLRNLQLGEDIEEAASAETRALQETESLRERTAYLSEIIAQTKEELSLTEIQKQELEELSEQRGIRISELELETSELYQTQQLLDTEVASLNQQVEAIRAQRDTLTARIASMNQTISDLNALVDSKTSDFEALTASFDAKQEELRSVEELLAAQKNEARGLQATLAELRDLEASQRQRAADLERIKDESERLIQTLIAESGLKDDQIQELTEARRKQSAELAALLTDLDTVKQSYNESLESIEQLQGQLAKRTVELQDMTLASAQLQGVIEQLETLKTEQGSTIEQQVETQAQLREELSRRLTEVLELERQLAAKIDEVEQLTAVERVSQAELTRTQNQLSTVLNELELAKSSGEALSQQQQTQIASISQDLSQSEQTIEEQKQELSSLKTLYSERLSDLQRVESEFIERERELARMQEQLASSIEHASTLQDRLQSKVTEVDTLNTKIAALGDEVSTLTGSETRNKAMISQLIAENLQYQDQISAQQQEIQDLEQSIQQAHIQNEDYRRELDYTRRLQADRQKQIETLRTVMQQLSSDLKAREQRVETLLSENERLLKSGVQGDQQIAELRQAYQQRLTELADLQTVLAARSGEVEQLQSELVELKEESQIMLRPARSPINRYVVEVFYSKSPTGDNVFQYRLPGEASATRVSRAELDSVLNKLKNERSEGLYTKVVFPNEDHLTFAEAWSFTRQIQSNYDYYSQ